MALADTCSFSYVNGAQRITLTGDLTTDASNNILDVTNSTYSDTITGISGLLADRNCLSSQDGIFRRFELVDISWMQKRRRLLRCNPRRFCV